MEKSDSIKNLSAALLRFDTEVDKIGKKATNPFFKNKYAPLPEILDSIKEPLQKAGLTVKQFPEGSHGLTTMIFHPESGEWISSTYFMSPVKDDPQSEGSRITYQRRYAIGAVLGLNIDEDDDGNKASDPQLNTASAPSDAPWLNDNQLKTILNRLQLGDYGEGIKTADEFRNKIFGAYKMKKEYKEQIREAKFLGD